MADVLVDGKSVGPFTTYTFVSVTADYTIKAKFKKKEEPDYGGGCGISRNGENNHNYR